MSDDALIEAMGVAIAKALYGEKFDPFQQPETYAFCDHLARAALAAYRASQPPMSDEIKALVEQLEAWAPLVSSGYEVPAAGQTMMNASRALTAQAEEIARLRTTVRRVQSAAKTIMHHEGDELARLRKQAQEHHLAMRTLDSEREANALLTDEVERLRARLEITDEITERYDGIACRDETIRLLEQKIAALKAAQEVKA